MQNRFSSLLFPEKTANQMSICWSGAYTDVSKAGLGLGLLRLTGSLEHGLSHLMSGGMSLNLTSRGDRPVTLHVHALPAGAWCYPSGSFRACERAHRQRRRDDPMFLQGVRNDAGETWLGIQIAYDIWHGHIRAKNVKVARSEAT